jgi:hypothetical protein
MSRSMSLEFGSTEFRSIGISISMSKSMSRSRSRSRSLEFKSIIFAQSKSILNLGA